MFDNVSTVEAVVDLECWQAMHGTLKDQILRHYWIIAVVIVAGLVAMPATSGAQEINDCNSANAYLKKTVADANHCRHAADCVTPKIEGVRSVGCGLLFSSAERAKVDSAIDTYARLCGPHWHCLAWTLTHEVACIRNKCEWHPKSGPSIEDLQDADD